MAGDNNLLAFFTHVDDLIAALRRLKGERYSVRTVFSPLPVPEVQEILGGRTSAVRFVVFFGAILGGAGLVGLAAYAHLAYNLVTGGKPVLPWIPWVVVCFEGMVLGGVITATLSWILAGRLPRLKPPQGSDGAFVQDRFGILVAYGYGEEEPVRRLLEEEGAEEVRHVS